MRKVIFVILIVGIQTLYGQSKTEYSDLETIHIVQNFDSEDWIFYVTNDLSFCFAKEDIIQEQTKRIYTFESYIDSLSKPAKWHLKRLSQLKSMKSYLMQKRNIVIIDPMLSIEKFNITDPNPFEFTSLNIDELMCPILNEGRVEITFHGEYINSYQKANVFEYDPFSETRSMQYLIAKDSVVLLQCAPIVHADFEIEEK